MHTSSVLNSLCRACPLAFFNSSNWSQSYLKEILQWLPRATDETADHLLAVLEESCECLKQGDSSYTRYVCEARSGL